MSKPWRVPPEAAKSVTVQRAHREWAEAYCRAHDLEVHEFYDAILALGCDAGMLAQRHPGVMKAGLLLLCAMAEADPDYASAVEAAFLPRLKEMTRLRLVTDEEEA